MSMPFIIYVISLLDNLIYLSVIICVICAISVFDATGYDNDKQFNISAIIFIASAAMFFFTPNEKTCYMMLASKIAVNTYDSEVGKDLSEIVKLKLLEYKKELVEKAIGESK